MNYSYDNVIVNEPRGRDRSKVKIWSLAALKCSAFFTKQHKVAFSRAERELRDLVAQVYERTSTLESLFYETGPQLAILINGSSKTPVSVSKLKRWLLRPGLQTSVQRKRPISSYNKTTTQSAAPSYARRISSGRSQLISNQQRGQHSHQLSIILPSFCRLTLTHVHTNSVTRAECS